MTTLLESSKREFTPGTTGWTADDLLDPQIERLWDKGRYEIVEGVLTIVPAAQLDGGMSLQSLIILVNDYMRSHDLRGRFATEADYIIDQRRVARVDALLVMEKDLPLYRRTGRASTRVKSKGRIGRITKPPMLIIELVSFGHEQHDRVVKRGWYERAGVPLFWILDELKRSLECFRNGGRKFVLDARGRDDDDVRPSLFRGLTIPLKELWV